MTDRAMTPRRPLLAAPVLICALHLASALTLGTSPWGSLISNSLQLAAGVMAAWMSFGASRRSTGFARRFWTLVGAAFVIWSAGQSTYIYHENWIGERVPQPSWTHFLFRLYGAPLLMALLITQEEDQDPRGYDWQRILDAAQVGILFLLFYFDLYFVPGGQWQGLTLLYLWGFFDLSDLENWSLFAAFLVRSRLSRRPEERAASLRITPYLLAYALGSSFYNYTFMVRPLRTGDVADLVFTLALGTGALLAAFWKEDRVALEPEGRLPVVTWAPAVLPLIIIGLALPMARSEPAVAVVAVFGSVACFGARLLITLYRHQRVMEALKASESRYASLLTLAPDAIFVHTDGRITFANPATARLLGTGAPSEVVGRHVLEFAPPELREEYASLASRDSGPASLVILRADGARRQLEAVGMRMESEGVERSSITRLVIARDVTERRQAEAERESLIRALEAKNAELERFTYTVSHDLRSPLVTIGAFVTHVEEAAERGDLTALRADLGRIRRASLKMDLLLKDLLELSRVGLVMAPAEVIPFETLAREAEAQVQGRLAARGIEVDIQSGLPMVRGDRVRLLEVIQNLIDNAAKFMGDQKDPRIEIGARGQGAETVFFVRDNGIGIDPQHHERIFGLFDKLDSGADGTGVGLALVKRIVELHGGRIWVESEGSGEGAVFCFTLPLV